MNEFLEHKNGREDGEVYKNVRERVKILEKHLIKFN